MTQIILIILGTVIIALLLTRKTRESVVGICAAALDQTVRKNANKEKVLEFIREKSKGSPSTPFDKTQDRSLGVNNEEIRERLGVSRRSAVRYLDALEREGKVEQVGDSGRGVTYRAK